MPNLSNRPLSYMKGDYRDLYETNDFEIINIVKYNTSWYYDIHYSVSTKNTVNYFLA